MRNVTRLLLISSVSALLSVGCFGDEGDEPEATEEPTATAEPTSTATFVPGGESGAFLVRTDAWDVGGAIPVQYTCDGDNLIPPLTFIDIPERAETLALIVNDPSAGDDGFVHWAVWNLPLDDIEEGQVPAGAVEGLNGSGEDGYTGPCPPAQHTYFFYAYALDRALDLPAGSTVDDLEDEIEDHAIAQSEYIGTYQRP
jgi:Raf kinase inhibitor-like YbhB/YbcL family protein